MPLQRLEQFDSDCCLDGFLVVANGFADGLGDGWREFFIALKDAAHHGV